MGRVHGGAVQAKVAEVKPPQPQEEQQAKQPSQLEQPQSQTQVKQAQPPQPQQAKQPQSQPQQQQPEIKPEPKKSGFASMIGVVQAKAAQVKQTQPTQEQPPQSEQPQAVTVTPAAAAAAGGFLSLFKGKRSDAQTAKSPTQEHSDKPLAQDSKTHSKPIGTSKKEPSQEEDLIKVVLTAVEDNWLRQAPGTPLDKSRALQVERSLDLDHSDCESRDTSEADYLKVKEKAQKPGASDDEGAQLCRQESNGESSYLPYLETTLPQERPGTVTITQSSKRVSTSLASVERPRSASNRNPGKLDDFKKSGQSQAVPPMKVVLPRQDSKSAKSSKAKPWDEFAKQALGSPKQARRGQQSSGPSSRPTSTTPKPTGTTTKPTGTTPRPTGTTHKGPGPGPGGFGGTAPKPTGTAPKPTATAPKPTGTTSRTPTATKTNKRPEATATAKPEVASKPKISKTSTAFASMRAFGGFKPAAEKPASASTASKPPVLTRKPSKTSMAAASYVRGSAFDSKP